MRTLRGRSLATLFSVALLMSLVIATPVSEGAVLRSGEGSCVRISTDNPPDAWLDPNCTPSCCSEMGLTLRVIAEGVDAVLDWTEDGPGVTEVDHFVILRGTGSETAEQVDTVSADQPWTYTDELGVLGGGVWYGVQAISSDGDVIAHASGYTQYHIGE